MPGRHALLAACSGPGRRSGSPPRIFRPVGLPFEPIPICATNARMAQYLRCHSTARSVHIRVGRVKGARR
jgi:hypothetical protein